VHAIVYKPRALHAVLVLRSCNDSAAVLQGLRILEYACDYAAEHTVQPLSVWKLLEKEVAVSVTLPLHLLAGRAMLSV
jgi:hypothetical protein